MDQALLFRHDDLRRFAADLAARLGVAPVRASALASQLLWYDAAGASHLGIVTLAGLLHALQSGAIDPAAEAVIGPERNGTAVVDGGRGVPALVLARAAEVAMEKAREAGVGVVRVDNVGPLASAAAIVAELAVGPFAAVAIGPAPGDATAPGRTYALAVPSRLGPPVVVAPGLEPPAAPPRGSRRSVPRRGAAAEPDLVAVFLDALRPPSSWLLAVLSAQAFEPLARLQERVASGPAADAPDGVLTPQRLQSSRAQAHGTGVRVEPADWKALTGWAGRLTVPPPEPRSP